MRGIYVWAPTAAFMAFLCLQQGVQAAEETLTASYLRCEYRVDPAGIDVTTPRLSWTLQSDQRGQKQTAYRILVAASAEQLAEHTGDLWDSGRIQDDQTAAVKYAGAALTSNQECFWKVKVWDKDGAECGWSQPARWSMGLLTPSDWQAQWIGYDPPQADPQTPAVISQANWIWTDAQAAQGTQPGTRYFRRSFHIPANITIDEAVCYMTADDSFTLYVNGHQTQGGTSHKVLKEIRLKDYLVTGTNVLAVSAANDGDSSNPAGLLAAIHLTSVDNQTLDIVSDAQWRSSHAAAPGWTAVDFDDASWSAAHVLGAFGMSPWQGTALKVLPPARYLRTSCTLAPKPIKKAGLYATSLGIYQLYVNGRHVSKDYFSPGWTDYTKRVYYRTYDVTDVLKSGDNAIGAVLADGWFAGYVGYAGQRNHYGQKLRLLCQLNIEYEDGTKQVVASGPGWKGSLGPILQADFLQGEFYDARREMPGWSTAGFDDSAWQTVVTGGNEVSPAVEAAVSEPVIAFEEITPVSVSEPESGKYVFDMGQNFAGVVRLRLQGSVGQVVTIRHAERLNPDGTLYTANLRSAAQTDTYICKGDGVETWQPYFTFHGFQYVELSGLEARPPLDTLTGLALSSDTPTAGTFACSDPMVNKIQVNSVWTQRANFIDVPTDCPQRDERLGWTGDAQVYINTAAYHNDVQPFFIKWLIDLADAQRSDGQYPTVAPLKVSHGDGGPAWADAGVICPWTVYKMYGDRQILETHYEGMKRFIDFCKNRCTADLLPPSSFHCFGDWVNINDNTPNDVIYMAYFGYSTKLMAQIATVLGQSADASAFEQLFEQIKASFNRAYVAADGKIKGDSQCAYVLAIAYDLLDAETRKLAAGHLIRRIKECGWHLSTGFVGTKDLMLALAKIGRNDVAYRLLHNDTFPSWGFSIKNGATSIWERWNGWTPEDGFNDPGMNSFAHYSFGAVCQWIFENIAGIQAGSAGFEHIVLKPSPGGKLTWAKTTYQSIRGPIVTDWKLTGAVFDCNVTIPPNTTATLYLPAKTAAQITESGSPAAQAEGVTFLRYENGCAVYTLQSGAYRFKSRIGWTRSAWSTDADAGVSAGKTYTHAVNLHTDETKSTAVNGVAFESDSNRSGSGWTLTGAPLTHSSDAGIEVAGAGKGLITDFFYHEPAQLELTGLEAGSDYVFTFYTRGFGEVGRRLVNVTASDDGMAALLDQNVYGNGQGALFKYAYTAPASGSLQIAFDAADSGETWHHYAFSNERAATLYLDPVPVPESRITVYDRLNWTLNGVADHPTYRLKLATDPAFVNIVEDISGLTAATYKPALLPETTYYWQVAVMQNMDVIHSSPTWTFSTLPVPPDAEKVAQWRFDETSGTTVRQSVPAIEGHGVLHGCNDPASDRVHVKGLSGHALCLNGADEYVDISSVHSAMPSAGGQSFAISGYFRTFGSYGPLFSMRNSQSETPIIDIVIGADGVQNQPGKVCVLVRDNTGSMNYMNSGVQFNDGFWHNFILSRTDGDWKLYMDGTLTAAMSNTAAGALTLDWLAIGSSIEWLTSDWQPHNNHYRFFSGCVDEFCVWQGQLQPRQFEELAAGLPRIGDLNFDHKIDLADFAALGAAWKHDLFVPAALLTVLEDTESDVLQRWQAVSESGFGATTLSLEPDPHALHGQVLRWDYSFAGSSSVKTLFRLDQNRPDLALYDALQLRIMKLSASAGDVLTADIWDGRYNSDPEAQGLYFKGRVQYDLSDLQENQWHVLQFGIPYDFTGASAATCHDLVRIDFTVSQSSTAGSGAILVAGIELTDDTADCIPAIQDVMTDLNADCMVDIRDFVIIADHWMR